MSGTLPVDTSFYNRAGYQGIPPGQSLDTVEKVAGIGRTMAEVQNLRNANQQFQAEYGAKQAFGQIMQKHVNADGTPDTEGALTEAATNPTTAFMFPQFAKSLADTKQVNLENVAKNLENKLTVNGAIARTAAAVAAGTDPNDPQGSNTALHAGVSMLAQSGLVPPDQIAAFTEGLPSDLQQRKTALLTAAQAHANENDSINRAVPQLLQWTRGRVSGYDALTPGATLYGRPPLQGQAAEYPQQTPLGDLNAPVEVEGATGRKTLQPSVNTKVTFDAGPGGKPVVINPGVTPGVTKQAPFQISTIDDIRENNKRLAVDLPREDLVLQRIKTLLMPGPDGKSPVETGAIQGSLNELAAGAKFIMTKGFGQSEEQANAILSKYLGTTQGDPTAAYQELRKYLLFQAGQQAVGNLPPGDKLTNDKWNQFQGALASPDLTPQTLRGLQRFYETLNAQKHEQLNLGQDFLRRTDAGTWNAPASSFWDLYAHRLQQKGLDKYDESAP